MWYSCLLTNPEKELPIFLSNIEKDYEFNYSSINSYIREKKWKILKEAFYKDRELKKQTLLGFNLIVSYGFIAVEVDTQFRILALKTNKVLYLDKELPLAYRKLYLKFKDEIELIYNFDIDVVYTNNCGKNSFLQFNMPKFKSINDRNEYVHGLLDEYYETR